MRISSASTRIGGVAVAVAVPYVPFAAGWRPGEGVFAALAIGVTGLAAPALTGVLAAGARGAAGRTVAGLAAAAGLHLLTIAGLALLRVEPTAAAYAAVLGSLTVLTGAAGAALRPLPTPPRGSAFALGLGAFALFAFGGTRVVPPLEDQDFEIQATANGLVRDLSPVCLTNRNRLHFFAHPPLLHVLAAGSLTLAGDLETVRPSWEVAREELAKLAPHERERGPAAALRAFRERPPVPDRGELWFRRVYRHFAESPALAGTRAPNFVLGALVVVLVLAAASRLGVSRPDAALAAAVYATLPEVFVRSSYGGYYALSAATMLAGALLAAGRRGGSSAGLVAGALSAWANHKAVVLAAAVTAHHALRRLVTRGAERWGPARPVTVGVLAGLAAFWAWGLAIAPADFVGEHVLDHGLRRFAGGEVLSRAGRAVYPSRAGLWLEFARHMGWVWTALAAVGVAAGVRRAASGPAAADPERDLTGILVAGTVVGAIVFTAIDWRQTKHLCLLVPALAVLGAAWLPRAPWRARVAVRLALVFSLGWNVAWIVRLARDFRSLPVTPLW